MIEYYKDEDLDKISKNQKKYKIIYGIILFCLMMIHAVVILLLPDQKIIFIVIQVILDAVIFGGILYHYETQYMVNKKLLNLLKRILHKQREALVGTIISINPNPYTYQGII